MTGVERRRHRSEAAREIGGLDVVAALRHGRRVARLSQRDLARRAGVSQSLIARIEARRVDPPVGLLQRLLGLCGMRWELRLEPAGATPAAASARSVAVRKSARVLSGAVSDRRVGENAAARAMGAQLAGSLLTVRERRRCIREVRLAERAAQGAAFTQLIARYDSRALEWLERDAAEELERFDRCIAHLRVAPERRLSARFRGPAAEDLRLLLEALSHRWAWPPVALTGIAARAAWSPGSRTREHGVVELAPVRDRAEAVAFLAGLGARGRQEDREPMSARSQEGDMFTLGELVVRLRDAGAPSSSLVEWRPGRPPRAIALARPECRPEVACDRHTIRAALECAGRDRRGRRRPPYHEALDGAVLPWWFGRFGPNGGCDASRDVAWLP